MRISFTSSKKGYEVSIPALLATILAVALVLFIIVFVHGEFLKIHPVIEGMKHTRRTVNLAQVMIGSERFLAFSEDGTVYKGVLDVDKLNDVKNRVDELGYPDQLYKASVVVLEDENLEGKKEWEWDKGGREMGIRETLGIGELETTTIPIPVAIRYGEGDIRVGLLTIESFGADCPTMCRINEDHQYDEGKCKASCKGEEVVLEGFPCPVGGEVCCCWD